MFMEKAYELVTMNLRYDEFNAFETLHKFYRESEPTTRKVLRLLKADLKRYIRGLDKVFLLTFLHFVTGTNIVSNISKLPVSFMKMQDFQRQPITHTC